MSDIIHLNVGDTYCIQKSSNATTGNSWKYMHTPNIRVSSDYEYTGKPGVSGAGGMETFYIEAIKEGPARLYMWYSQDWSDSEYDRECIYKFRIH